MKKYILPALLLTVIAILIGALVHEIRLRHTVAKNHEQFSIALAVQLYQGLESGEVDAVKRRLGGFVAANSLLYEQKYGLESGTKFTPRLEEAKVIRETFQASSK